MSNNDVRSRYEQITSELFRNKEKFADFLTLSGRLYKLPSAQLMAVFMENPDARMVADYATWQKFGRQVKRGEKSISYLSNGEVRECFDISQTAGEKEPFQWRFNKFTGEEFKKRFAAEHNGNFISISQCVNYSAAEEMNENISIIAENLNISKQNRNAFQKSVRSMVRHIIASRCEYQGAYKINTAPTDLSAVDMLHNKEEFEKLCEWVQITAKSALRKVETMVNKIIFERSIEDERERNERLTENNHGEQQDVQAQSYNANVLGGADGELQQGGIGNVETANRGIRTGVAEIYGGKLSSRDSTSGEESAVRSDSSASEYRGGGALQHSDGELGGSTPPSNDIHRNSRVGKDEDTDVQTASNGGRGTQTARDLSGATYITKTAELKNSAVDLSDNHERKQQSANYSDFYENNNFERTAVDVGEAFLKDEKNADFIKKVVKLNKDAYSSDRELAAFAYALEDFGMVEKFSARLDKQLAEQEAREEALEQESKLIKAVRGGAVAKIEEKPSDVSSSIPIENAIANKISNIRLVYNNESGFHLIADTDKVNDAVITVFGQNELEVRDYLNENAVSTTIERGENGVTYNTESAESKAEEEEPVQSAEFSDNEPEYEQQSVFDMDTEREEQDDPPAETAEKHDYTITNEHLGEGGAKAKYVANIAAIQTLKAVESENRLATPAEQEVLSKYVGWGGIPQAFDNENAAWSHEYTQLKELLTPDEYEAARSTVLNAHYTSPTIISAIYSALDNFGFKGGNILEPSMGIGNFFGAMPEKLRANSRLSGVELDDVSGRMAKQLYQNADIQVCGYENTVFSDNYFDAAIGNVPFGNYGVADKNYDKEHFLIHDYFFAKSLDKVAPNGIVAFITSKGTLDKTSPKVREYLAKRADLIGAIRLPNNAFKANANTEVTSDIIFLQKREKMAVELPDWVYTAKNADGITVNQYFINHPEMVLGEMRLVNGRYGEETTCVPIEGAELKERLQEAVSRLKKDIIVTRREQKRSEDYGIIPATPDVRNFTHTLVDGKMYFRENNIMREVEETGATLARMLALHELRNTLRTLITAQENQCTDEQLKNHQDILNNQYDKFVEKFGNINSRANSSCFNSDDDYNILCALENYNPEEKIYFKSDIFTKRTVKAITEITSVNTPQEALQVSLDMRGVVDIDYMSELCKTSSEEVIKELSDGGLIYKNPETEQYNEAAEYLSGNIREKLRKAQDATKENPLFQRNVTALEGVLPEKITAAEITARIGVNWIDINDYKDFMCEYALADPYAMNTLHRTAMGEYKIEAKRRNKGIAATSTFGTSRMTSIEIFERLLNNRDIIVKDKHEDNDGKVYYTVNTKETQLAQNKASAMKEAFSRWIWEEPSRREKYETRYNELFNSLVGREYDGSHQTFPGMSPFITLNPHQLNAVQRAKLGGNTLLAHCVGAGKSFEMIAATMEKKRLGLINKACVVVPKPLVRQMSNEWLRLYPDAKILVAGENDFIENNRQKFIGRCCTGDYAAVIMSQQQFEKIPMSLEYRMNFIQRELDIINIGIADGKSSGNRGTVKELERAKKNIETKIAKLLNAKTKDEALTFEQLGFDSLVVDEAHGYKNGMVVTKMNNVAGVQTRAAQKSEDILMKTQYLNEQSDCKNIIFATGTPISNSMVEMYIMQRYLRPDLLENAGFENFDDWASTFGEVVTQLEQTPDGRNFRPKKRFAKFANLPELMMMYKEFADIRTPEMIKLPVPTIKGGKAETILAKPTEFQETYVQQLAERSELIHSGSVDPSEDNMLKITHEARLLGLDPRCINPDAENDPNSKVNLCIDKIMEIYNRTSEQNGVQAVFCDVAVNDTNSAGKSTFSVYNYIREELVRRGIPSEEICAANDAKTDVQRTEMMSQLNSGAKRIILASTSKMGTGANFQQKLCALHHLDIPWKPSDLEQRNGRILRQGNENKEVEIYHYLTEKTFDSYMMSIIVNKQKFISQIMSGKTPARTCQDVDEMVLNYSEMQAIASGDPRIKEKLELDGDVARLRMLESEYKANRFSMLNEVEHYNNEIKRLTEVVIPKCETDFEFTKSHTLPPDAFEIEICGKRFTERKEAGKALRKQIIEVLREHQSKEVGEYRGFKVSLSADFGYSPNIKLHRAEGLSYYSETNLDTDIGNITRIENLVNDGIKNSLKSYNNQLQYAKENLDAAQKELATPFEHAAELAEKSARLEQLDSDLNIDKVDEVIIDNDEDNHDNEKEIREETSTRKQPKSPKH